MRVRGPLGIALAVIALLAPAGAVARAQTVGQVFRQVKGAVVTIRTSERDAARGGETALPGVGSGVLISHHLEDDATR